MIIAVAWIALPTVVLLAYSVWQTPIYYPRYLCYTSPAIALLLAVCIVAVARTRERVTAVLAALALAATPNYLLNQRGPYAKEGMDFSQVADVITAHASRGDCLILDNTAAWKPGPIRPLTAARPAAYAKLVDPGRGQRAADRNRLWDAHLAIWSVADRVRQCTVLWTVSERDAVVPQHQSGLGLNPVHRSWDRRASCSTRRSSRRIDREQVYVTNAVKHFKFTLPERGKRRIHKTPSRTEVVACRPWLIAEMMSVQPNVVVLMGATAAQSLIAAHFG